MFLDVFIICLQFEREKGERWAATARYFHNLRVKEAAEEGEDEEDIEFIPQNKLIVSIHINSSCIRVESVNSANGKTWSRK